ncbi:patatin phospholipase domain-containing protein 4-like [Marmota monax]|uniref:Patatin phospholipase domain-containing protein 4-like n=1 Tax=Marmota monax TaxID=9995 RepID=A0A834UYC3_MARMO|nr:patatin phospholipase domain-containing protein 4-like [Marmota monax]
MTSQTSALIGLAAGAVNTEVPQACIGRMKPINLSFAACGFLGIYHLGAASAFCRHGKRLLKGVKAFAGASAGSLVASVLLTAPEKIEECNRFTYQFAEETRKQSFGAMTPGYDFMARLRSGVESILPPNAHELAHDRLYVSITNTRTRQNYLVSHFPSREDLIKKWVDGGLTNSLPVLPAGRTVTISPFCGRPDISPQDKGQLSVYIKVTNQDIMLSLPNLMRLNQALFPPSRRKMESLYRRGFDDTVQFLHKEDWFE